VSRERPIIFDAPSVRAVLAGTKTQARRICAERSPHWIVDERGNGTRWLMVARDSVRGATLRDPAWIPAASPFGEPGDRLWVRETWTPYYGGMFGGTVGEVEPAGSTGIAYYADGARVRNDSFQRLNLKGHSVLAGAENTHARWRPSIHMPRWAARLFLEVTAVRVERLQAITEEDARTEGARATDAAQIFQRVGTSEYGLQHVRQVKELENTARGAFACLWDSINGDRAPWASNPFVWVVEFKRVEADAVRGAA